MTDLQRLTAAVEDLRLEHEVLAGLVRGLAWRVGLRPSLRTGAMCRLAGISKSTLYSWDRRRLVARQHDALGEVCWDRDEVLRVGAGQAGERRGRPRPRLRNV